MLNSTILYLSDAKAGKLDHYHFDGADDYYAKEGDSRQWGGKGAALLGLFGEIDKADYSNLLRGILPGSPNPVRTSGRLDSKTRVGIDLQFSAPKSVSMQALVARDVTVLEAHNRAVDAVLIEIERYAMTRHKVDGKSYAETTGNLIFAKYRHETSRAADPHLHTHAIAMNLTRRQDGEWRALLNEAIIKKAKVFGAMYRSELAAELTKAGYELRLEGDTFELAHISRSQILEFSARSSKIEEVLESKGLSRATASTEEKQRIAYATRPKKEALDREAVMKQWLSIADSIAVDFNKRTASYDSHEIEKLNKDVDKSLRDLPIKELSKRAVTYAINHLTERSSIVSESQVLQIALEHAMSRCKAQDIKEEIKKQIDSGKLVLSDEQYHSPSNPAISKTRKDWVRELGGSKSAVMEVEKAILSGRLIKGESRLTTQRLLDSEFRILSRVYNGRGAMIPIHNHIDSISLIDPTLRSDQRAASMMILESKDQFTGIQGKAGVGKSYLLKKTIPLIEAAGYNVILLAPYGQQKKALEEDGLACKTVASFLATRSRSLGLSDKTVVILDEAGVVPTRIMDRLSKLVVDAGARMTSLGDIHQTKAIEAGMPFAIMQAFGMETKVMGDIQRQKDSPLLKESVINASEGRAKKALSYIESVTEIGDHQNRYIEVANRYTSLPLSEREKTIVLSGTNESRMEINKNIRAQLGLSGNGRNFKCLVRWDSTQAERRFSKYYQIGDIVQPEIDYPRTGLQRYHEYRILAKDGNRLTLKNEAGELFTINPSSHTKLSVYKERSNEFSVGDFVRITRNNAALDLSNGDKFTVQHVGTESIVLKNQDKEITFSALDRLHLDYAYCSTVHSAQGLTAERVIANMESKSRTVSADWFYVAISRAKKAVDILTDSIKALPAAVSRSSSKTSAIEISNQKVSRKLERHHMKDMEL